MLRATRLLLARETPGLVIAGILFFTVSAAPAQTASPAVQKPSDPGTPLPEISLEKFGTLGYEQDKNGQALITATGGVTLTYGDLRIQADKITYSGEDRIIEATGNVSVVRGDESLRGERFIFRGTEGSAESERSVIISPPFYFVAEQFLQNENGVLIRNTRIVPSPDGKAEISLSAREIQLESASRKVILRDMTIRLFGTRLLTIRHARIPIGLNDRDQDRDRARTSLPLTIRASGVAGVAVGLRLPVILGDRVTGEYGVEFAQKTSPQYFGRVRYDVIPREFIGRERSQSTLFTLPGGMGDQPQERVSPIRQLAIARPLPPTPDPILDYDSILMSSDPLERPVRSLNRFLFVEAAISGNRDIGSKRQGPLLLSRTPEVQFSGSLPLISKLPRGASNAVLRRFLQRPHLQITGNGSIGHYRERRLQNDKQTISAGRTGMSFGLETLPLLIGNHLLFRPQVNANFFRYDSEGSPEYRFIESSVALDYIFFARTMLGGSYIRRDQSGSTPFTFDQVDTRDEGQLRGQMGLPGGRFTLATQLRYDLKQGRLFDTEIAVAWRGKAIEPRFSYRTQNSQFGFGVTLPGFLP